MRIYYNKFSSIFRYSFPKDLEAIGQISLTPDSLLINSAICYYEDLEEDIPFSGNFQNPKVYKEYIWETCEKYKDVNAVRSWFNKGSKEEILLNNEWVPMPDDYYKIKKVYLLGELIKEEKYYPTKEYKKDFYKTDELINYYTQKSLEQNSK